MSLEWVLVAVVVGAEPSKAVGGPPPVVRAADGSRHPIADKGFATLFYNAQNGSPDVSVGTLELVPGAAVPEHVHEASGEWLYVVRGEVELTTMGRTQLVQAGSVVHLPKGQKHQAKVPSTAKESFFAVQLYSPAGPEQRFVKRSALDGGSP